MMAGNNACRGVIADFEDMRTPWDDEPIPDYSWLVKHTSDEWRDMILAETARCCLAEVAGSTGPLGSDSSGIETTRYEMVEKNKKDDDKVKTRQKTYWKYHIAAILGLQVILSTSPHPATSKTRPHFQQC